MRERAIVLTLYVRQSCSQSDCHADSRAVSQTVSHSTADLIDGSPSTFKVLDYLSSFNVLVF